MAKSSLNPGNKNEGMDGDHDCVASNARLVFENIFKKQTEFFISIEPRCTLEKFRQPTANHYVQSTWMISVQNSSCKKRTNQGTRAQQEEKRTTLHVGAWYEKPGFTWSVLGFKREENRLVISLYSVSFTDEFSPNFGSPLWIHHRIINH